MLPYLAGRPAREVAVRGDHVACLGDPRAVDGEQFQRRGVDAVHDPGGVQVRDDLLPEAARFGRQTGGRLNLDCSTDPIGSASSRSASIGRLSMGARTSLSIRSASRRASLT